MRSRTPIAVLLLAAALSAQYRWPSSSDKPEREMVAALLSLTDPAQAAWGAYLAANYEQSQFIPQILPLLNWQDSRVQAVALDSLIRLKAGVPEMYLTQFADSHLLDAALVILARDPTEHAAFLMSLLDKPLETDAHWVAVRSLLASAPPPGFAARLLRDWTLKFTLRVHDASSVSGGISAVSGGSGHGVGGGAPGFPPIATNFIVEHPQHGDTFLLSGPHPLYYRRFSGDRGFGVRRDSYRADYLLYLAGISKDDPTHRWPYPGIEWTSAVQYRSDAAAFLLGVRQYVQALTQRLTDRQRLTEDEAEASPPRLEITIEDTRQDQRVPLPPIDWRL